MVLKNLETPVILTRYQHALMRCLVSEYGQPRRPKRTLEPQWEVRYGSMGIDGYKLILGLPGGAVLLPDRETCQHRSKDPRSPFMDREAVAQALGCHPDTLSRRRKKLEADGLVGKKIEGSSFVWLREHVDAYVARKGLSGKRGRGRPRKYP